MADRPQKILLAQLNSNGDCLYATVIAKQIKEIDYPNSHLTWAVNSKCKQSVLLNPHVDEIWEVPTAASLTTYAEWEAFVKEAEQRKDNGEFDETFYTHIMGDSALKFDGGIRSTMYNLYPHPVTVKQQPVLRLSEDEKEVVKKYAEENALSSFEKVLLMECGPDSFRSVLNPASAYALAITLTAKDPTLAVILSSNKKAEQPTRQVFDGSLLSFRCNAELSKYCTLFAGCSSGISWLLTSDEAKPLPKVLIVSDENYYSSSMEYDHLYAGLPANDIIEIREREDALDKMQECLELIWKDSFAEARKKFHVHFRLKNYSFMHDNTTLKKRIGDQRAVFRIMRNIFRRNGLQKIPVLFFLRLLVKWPANAWKYRKRK